MAVDHVLREFFTTRIAGNVFHIAKGFFEKSFVVSHEFILAPVRGIVKVFAVFFDGVPDNILALLAHTRDLVLFHGDIIGEGVDFNIRGFTDHAHTLSDSVLACDEFRNERIDECHQFGVFIGCFHTPILACAVLCIKCNGRKVCNRRKPLSIKDLRRVGGSPKWVFLCLEEVGGIEPPSKKVPTRGVATCRNHYTPEGWGRGYAKLKVCASPLP